MDIPFEEVDVFMTVHLMLMTRITRCMFNCQSNMWAMSAVKAIHFCYYSSVVRNTSQEAKCPKCLDDEMKEVENPTRKPTPYFLFRYSAK